MEYGFAVQRMECGIWNMAFGYWNMARLAIGRWKMEDG